MTVLVDDLITLEERLLEVYLESRERAPTSVVAKAADEVRLIVVQEIEAESGACADARIAAYRARIYRRKGVDHG